MKPGRSIGEYRIGRFLGKGGMSEVYEAEHVRLGSRHAIKLFTYNKDVDGVRERFLTEGKLLAKLSHPRIVRVTEAGIDLETQRPYFVMDLVADREGNVRSLADIPDGGADEGQIAEWYEDIREGLAYIHGKGIIHRDLKLENVLIGPDGHAVLTDFGISKIAEAEDGAAVVDSVQTIVSLKDGKRPLMGSIGYMAPELEMGVAASPQSDYYALGVIVFRLLTGTWCDARTDLAGYLETFDPVWRQILPKLLHSNLHGRECPSWRELKAKQEESRLFEMESELESARGSVREGERRLVEVERELEAARGSVRKGKRRLRIVSVVLLAILVAAIACGGKLFHRPPLFEDIVFKPPYIPANEWDEEVEKNAWEMLHKLFDDLRNGRISGRDATSAVSEIAKTYNEDNEDALSELLNAAAERMRERYPEK